MTERKPIDAALDLFVFVPVGLAMTAAEELPKLAAKGRTRLTTQFTMARVVGQFAVTKVRQDLETRFATPTPAPAPPPEPAGASFREETTYEELLAEDQGPSTNGSGHASNPEPEADIEVATAGDLGRAAASSPRPDDLAIPGYDSLSASQVVQRLAGLSRGDLDLVQAYESAHRARRTILNRINQLQGS